MALTAAIPAAAGAAPPTGPPGPPPRNGGDLPVSPGTQPVFVPPGSAGAIQGGAPGPGLLNSDGVTFNRASRTFSLSFACQANGRVAVSASRIGPRAIASTAYRCAGGRTAPTFRVTPRAATAIARIRALAATATVRQSGQQVKLSFTLRARNGGAQQDFWTDGHLACAPDGSAERLAFLAAPDFTAQTTTPISTRGWVAWYTTAGGWHWLGQNGEGAAPWQTWTATPTGVSQFHPDGAVNTVPWTFGPIVVPSGQEIYAVGVYEIVYWVAGTPQYRWRYVNAGSTGAVAAGAPTLYCVYP
jgi:hypothetical protein